MHEFQNDDRRATNDACRVPDGRRHTGDGSQIPPEPGPIAGVVLELRVRNHPGTMSHISGLFARRGFNLEAILCLPERTGSDFSRILLLTADDPRLDQVERQLSKLYDVAEIRHRRDLGASVFDTLGEVAWGGDRDSTPVTEGSQRH